MELETPIASSAYMHNSLGSIFPINTVQDELCCKQTSIYCQLKQMFENSFDSVPHHILVVNQQLQLFKTSELICLAALQEGVVVMIGQPILGQSICVTGILQSQFTVSGKRIPRQNQDQKMISLFQNCFQAAVNDLALSKLHGYNMLIHSSLYPDHNSIPYLKAAVLLSTLFCNHIINQYTPQQLQSRISTLTGSPSFAKRLNRLKNHHIMFQNRLNPNNSFYLQMSNSLKFVLQKTNNSLNTPQINNHTLSQFKLNQITVQQLFSQIQNYQHSTNQLEQANQTQNQGINIFSPPFIVHLTRAVYSVDFLHLLKKQIAPKIQPDSVNPEWSLESKRKQRKIPSWELFTSGVCSAWGIINPSKSLWFQ